MRCELCICTMHMHMHLHLHCTCICICILHKVHADKEIYIMPMPTTKRMPKIEYKALVATEGAIAFFCQFFQKKFFWENVILVCFSTRWIRIWHPFFDLRLLNQDMPTFTTKMSTFLNFKFFVQTCFLGRWTRIWRLFTKISCIKYV